MQYPLLNRFQGALLGAIVGETIGRYAADIPTDPKLDYDRFTRFYAESLIYPERQERPDNPILQTSLSTVEAAIALLPVFLYFHENSLKLQQNLQDVLRVWQNSAVDSAHLRVVGTVISQTLLEILDPATITDGILEPIPSIQQAQTLLGQSVSLEDAVKSIQIAGGDCAIALSLYCFLSTAGEFRLSVLRAAQTRHQVPIVCALTGALSGAYNSARGIPIAWRLALEHWISTAGEPTTQRELLHLATQLFGQWSGIYDSRLVAADSSVPVVAAPQVIRRLP